MKAENRYTHHNLGSLYIYLCCSTLGCSFQSVHPFSYRKGIDEWRGNYKRKLMTREKSCVWFRIRVRQREMIGRV